MKTTSSPESYRYCTSFTSVCTRGNFSPARKVLSTTAPDSRLRSRERTNAPPLPGFTCWNSRMRQTAPSSWMCMPFRNWFVDTVSATATDFMEPAPRRLRPRLRCTLRDGCQLLGEAGKQLRLSVADDREVLDPDPAEAREVDP